MDIAYRTPQFPPRYHSAIMVARTQITLEPELHRRARMKALDLGVSFAEYFRRLVSHDLGRTSIPASPATVFDLGASGNSDIAANKHDMLAQAFSASRDKRRPA